MAGVQPTKLLVPQISDEQIEKCGNIFYYKNIESVNDLTDKLVRQLAESLGQDPDRWKRKLEELDPVLDKTKLEEMFNNLKKTCEVDDLPPSCMPTCGN